ncbi:hypothetical protein F4604DRAFT_1571152, partial [Suillus subluteus]
CGNCGNTSHPTKDCFGKGGLMEGKRDESTASNVKPAAATGKPGGLCYDTDGCAYLLDSETNHAIYIASASESTESPASSTEFAGLASDSITPAFIREISAGDEDEYTTLIASIGSLDTSLDWRKCTRPADFAGITYKAPNQRKRTVVDPSIVPVFLDSGASVHISNDEGNFFSLRPIPPRSVNGVGGSSIQALGIGTLRLVVARGIHITLDNVLYIPAVTASGI